MTRYEDRIDLDHQVAVMRGPMSGGMVYPPAFMSMDRPAGRAVEQVGRGMSHLINFLIPGKRLAELLVVANSQTRATLPHNVKGHIEELVEIELHRPTVTETSARP